MDIQDRQDDVNNQGGFTLIEVCLAVLVIGLGLLAIFSLFPSGLRAIEDDTADTRCGLFASTVMNGLKGNAVGITNWSEWCDSAVSVDLRTGVLGVGPIATAGVYDVVFPTNGAEHLRYRLTMNTASGTSYSAKLEVENGQYPAGTLIYPSTFYTEFYYQGK